MRDDADLIRKMMVAWFRNEKSDNFENLMELCRDDMARVLAVVRAHDAGPARRVPVQIVNMTQPGDASDTIIALASDGSLHRGQYACGAFLWNEQLPLLPQPGDGA